MFAASRKRHGVTSWGWSGLDQYVLDLCQRVVDLTEQMDKGELLDLLGNDREAAAGILYARAAHRGLVELRASGVQEVQQALSVLGNLVEGE
jgi:hypothetical protein